jgi:hypothetical protein
MKPTAKKQAAPIELKLKAEDRQQLRALLSHGLISARIFKRARVLQLLDEGRHSAQVCLALGTTRDLVRRIGLRYLKEGLAQALFERERPGSARLLDARHETQLVSLVCSPPPEGHARWTVRLVAQEAKARGLVKTVGRETVRLLLKHHDIKPWREKKVLHSAPHP